jgi:Rab9 effector protein with kelch motifs
MVIYGGSDGHASFSDVHVLDLSECVLECRGVGTLLTVSPCAESMVWTLVRTEVKHARLSHTATQFGSYLFVIGGHDGQSHVLVDSVFISLTTLSSSSGQKYAQEMLLLNLGEHQLLATQLMALKAHASGIA